MTLTEIIDQIVGRTDNVGLADGDYAQRRLRHQEYTIEEGQNIWNARQWKWKRTSTTLSISANAGFVNLPTDFGSIGRQTLLTNTATGTRLRWISEDEMRERKDQPGVTEGDPDEYSIYEQGSEYQYRLHVVTNSSALSIKFPYNKAFPTLTESDPTTVDNSKQIPEQYHQSVWIPAVRSLAAFHKGDQSWEEHQKQRDRGLLIMIRNERQPQDTLQQFPSFFGGRM